MPSRIMIVEDEFLIATEMADVVAELGHECIGIADDTDSAIVLASPEVDAALVDVNLSDGATGPIIGERLASEFGIRVVFVTANPNQLGDGVEGTLGAVTKPVEIETLARVLDFVLAGSDPATAKPPRGMKLFK